jgi:formylglycine-generating enzyme required for sulfatase activity
MLGWRLEFGPPSTSMDHEVFISYSKVDKTIADAVCDALRTLGIRCWIAPESILPGATWDNAIIDAIKASRVMVLVFSRHTNTSEDVQNEVYEALDQRKTIVPLRLDNSSLNGGLRYHLARKHWFDATTPLSQKDLTRFAKSVQQQLTLAPPSMPPTAEPPPVPVPEQPPTHPAVAPVSNERPNGWPPRRRKVEIRSLVVLVIVFVSLLIIANRYTGTPPPQTGMPGPAASSAPPNEPAKSGMQELTNSIGMNFKLIPAGEFRMGSLETESGRDPEDEEQHRVRITKPFYLGVFEVTQRQYERVMGSNPSHFDGDVERLPIESVTWEEASEFCTKLSELPEERAAGRRYELPTEAQWEYACRAGTTTPFHFGDELDGTQANCDGNYPYGTATPGPYLERTAEIGSYSQNEFGLYDMHGNVWEWCADWYDEEYYGESPIDDPPGPAEGGAVSHVIRGGCWHTSADFCRSAHRDLDKSDEPQAGIGFRVMCRLD